MDGAFWRTFLGSERWKHCVRVDLLIPPSHLVNIETLIPGQILDSLKPLNTLVCDLYGNYLYCEWGRPKGKWSFHREIRAEENSTFYLYSQSD